MDKGFDIRERFCNEFTARIWFKGSDKYEEFKIEYVGDGFLKTKDKDGIDLLIAIDDISVIAKIS